MASQPAGALAVALRRRWLWRRGCEQSTAQRQLCGAMAVREEADMADAVEPVRHGVEKEPPNEFVGSERQHLGLAVMIVFLGEVDLAVGEPGETRVCQRDAMGIAAEIGQHLLGTGEGSLGKNHPIDAS